MAMPLQRITCSCHSQVAARYGVVKVADFGLSRVTTLLRTGLGHTSFAGSRSLQQSFNEVRLKGL